MCSCVVPGTAVTDQLIALFIFSFPSCDDTGLFQIGSIVYFYTPMFAMIIMYFFIITHQFKDRFYGGVAIVLLGIVLIVVGQ